MTTISDDFNRANEALDAGPWTLVDWSGTSTGFNVVSNAAVISSSNRSGAIHDTALATDHQVQVRVEDFDVAVFARGDSAGTTGYFANVYSGDVELFKVVAGTVTFIDSVGSAAIALGDTLFIAVVGNRITWGKLDGATKTITDTSITTGTRVGIGASGNQGILDNFLAFDFTDQLTLTSIDDAADAAGTLTLDATGVTQNAKLCAVIVCDGGTYATPAGWTLEDSFNAGSNNTYVFSRVAGAGEGTHDWTRTGGFGGFGRLYQVAGTGTPDIHLTAINTDSGASTSHAAPAPGTATDPNLTLRHWVQIVGTATLTPTQIPLGSTIDNYWPEVASYEFLDAGAIGAVNCASNQNAGWFGVSVVFVEGAAAPGNDMGRATETETVRSWLASKVAALGRAVETSVARAFTASRAATVGRAIETETARGFTTPITRAFGRSVEAEVARGFTVIVPPEPTYRFDPPFVEEATRISHPHEGYAKFLSSLKLRKGIGLYLDGGVFKQTRVITEAIYAGKIDGVHYFRGGYVYTGIPKEVADILVASGYEPVLEE